MEAQAINVFKNISLLLQHGMFPGAHAVHVAQAISFVEQVVAEEEAKLKAAAEGYETRISSNAGLAVDSLGIKAAAASTPVLGSV